MTTEDKRREMLYQNRLSSNLARSGIPPWTRKERCLANFQKTMDNAKALAAVRDFLTGKVSPPLLLLIGVPGTGKSHLAFSAAWDYLEDGYSVIYNQVEDILNELQSHLDDGKEFRRLWSRLKDCDLLILDDMGAHNPTAWRTSQLDALVDYRYREALPLIMTANKLDFSERIPDRVKDGRSAVITGESWRGKGRRNEAIK